MLKLLLGHWKAHRKKPSLLPEEGDVHFEEPSTINPLFEDSDSISSSKSSAPSKPLEQNQNFSQAETGQNSAENNESLQTKTNSQVENEQHRTETNETIPNHVGSQVTTEKTKTETDTTTVNEATEVLIPVQSKDSEISKISIPTKEITGAENDNAENASTADDITESKHLEKERTFDNIESETSTQSKAALTIASHEENSSEISSKDKTEGSYSKGDENMRLYNQPSTSAITQNKKQVNEVTNGVEKAHISVSKSTNVLKVDKQENKEKNSSVRKTSGLDSAKVNPTSPFKPVIDNSATAKLIQHDKQDDKPTQLKAKAIDELIKKFQGPKTENKNESNNSKIDRKNSVNQSTSSEKLKENNVKTETANTSSPSTHINKDVHNATKPERKELHNINEPKTQTDISNKNIQEKEALSNIFKFPPPPPLEQLQNESSLHGKILKDRKINPLATVNKIKENESVKENNPGKTRSDSSLDRTRTASSSKPKSDIKLEKSETKASVNKTDQQPFKEASQLRSTEPENGVKNTPPNKNKEQVKIKANESSLHSKNITGVKLPAASKDDTVKNNTNETKTTESTPNSLQNDSNKKGFSPKTIDSSPAQSSHNDLKRKASPVSRPKTIDSSPPKSSQNDLKRKASPVSSPKTIDSSPAQSSQNDLKRRASPVSSPKVIDSSSPQSSQNDLKRKVSPVFSPKTEVFSKSVAKNLASTSKNAPKSPVQIHKSSISKASSKLESVIENENSKLHSEDSGITRGDQISSETTQEPPANDPSEQTKAAPNSVRKNKKEKKAKSVNKKVCKNCRHAHNDNIPIRRGSYDDYYDVLTGIKHHKNRHSDSWTSDLSWEERELLRRLRNRRGTVRSSTPSTRSKISKHRFIDENYFRRHHNFRRSISDESSFYGASLCSCDECWAMYLKEYAYGRASLRGMSPIQEICTCRNSHHNLLGRRVQFRPDIIQEASLSERTATTPAPSVEKKKDDDDDKTSQKSSKSKEGDSISTHPEGHKEKKSKKSEDIYRFVTPWELEELDLLMRKHLLKKRRRRARCMGVMALAMVVFIGLIVAIVMVYLRRKTL